MRPVLGFQLEVIAGPSDAPGAAAVWLQTQVDGWIRGWYERRGTPLTPNAPLAEAAVVPVGHTISVNREVPGPSTSLVEITWQYPADGDRSALWTSRATIAADAEGADLSLSLSIASVEFVARPFRFDVYVPRLIREIAQSGRAQLGGRALAARPRTVSVGNVVKFVEEDLKSPLRRLPLLLVAKTALDDRLPVDVTELAKELCGLAEVWVLSDRWTAYALSDAVGSRLSCFDGGIRTYWPGFDITDDPFSHPLITSRRQTEIEGTGTSVGRHLVRHLAPVGALRLADSPRAAAVRAQMAEVRRAEAKAAIKAGLALGEVDKLESQLLEAWEERDEERKRANELQEQLDAVRQNFALVSTTVSDVESGDGATEEPLADVVSVATALGRGERDFPILRVWRSAQTSAVASRYAHPDKVYRALEAIADVAAQVCDQQRTTMPLGNLEDLFAARGFGYAASDSQTTITKYGKDRTFTEEGNRLLFERHLTLGGGDRQNCLQIYFELDVKTGRADIGYCGVHLPYDGMRS